MNPYAFAEILRPAIQPDWRTRVNSVRSAGQDYSLSRAIYLAVSVGEWLRFKRQR